MTRPEDTFNCDLCGRPTPPERRAQTTAHTVICQDCMLAHTRPRDQLIREMASIFTETTEDERKVYEN